VSLFDGKDCLVLYDNGHRGNIMQEVALMILSPELEQVHVRSGVHTG
jgi:hypothetical protein